MLRRRLNKAESVITEKLNEDHKPVILTTKSAEQKVLGDVSSELKLLEKAVFGGESEFTEKLDDWCSGLLDNASTSSDEEGPVEESIKRNEEKEQLPILISSVDRKPAWIDEDDESELKIPKNSRKYAKITAYDQDDIKDAKHYTNKLKAHYEKCIASTPRWADISSKVKKRRRNYSNTDSENEDDLLKRTGNYIGKSVSLPKETLEFKRICEVTASHKIKAVVNTTEFHKQARVMLVSGYTQRVMLFKLDDDENELLHSIKFDSFPIETSHFSSDGQCIYVGSMMHPYFYMYDMHSDKITKVPSIRHLNQQKMGKFVVSSDNRTIAFRGVMGSIHLLAAKTCDYIGTLKMNGQVGAICFSSSGDTLYSHGDDGQVYVWDINSRQCVHKFTDNGCIKGTSVGISNDDSYIACGSNTGVVNLYETTSALSSVCPSPIKSIMNLTTSVNSIGFNGNGELLSTSSNNKDNSLRMFHIPSRSTFKNFPQEGERLNKINSSDFSPNNGYFCCGNDKGQAFLYRLFHYDSY